MRAYADRLDEVEPIGLVSVEFGVHFARKPSIDVRLLLGELNETPPRYLTAVVQRTVIVGYKFHARKLEINHETTLADVSYAVALRGEE